MGRYYNLSGRKRHLQRLKSNLNAVATPISGGRRVGTQEQGTRRRAFAKLAGVRPKRLNAEKKFKKVTTYKEGTVMRPVFDLRGQPKTDWQTGKPLMVPKKESIPITKLVEVTEGKKGKSKRAPSSKGTRGRGAHSFSRHGTKRSERGRRQPSGKAGTVKGSGQRR